MRAGLLPAQKTRLLQSKAAAVGWKRPLLILGGPRSPVEQTSLCAVRKPAQRRRAFAMQAQVKIDNIYDSQMASGPWPGC